MKLKVCGLRDEVNFMEVVALNLDFLGLNFIPSSLRFIEIEQAKKLSGIARGKALLTGLFLDQPPEYISEVVGAVKLDCIQIYGEAAKAKDLKAVLPQVIVLKSVTVNSLASADVEGVDYLLVDNEKGGSGVKFDWKQLSNYQGKTPLIIAGGIGPEDVDAVREIAEANPLIHGVDVNSRFEISVANKDIAKIRKFNELLRR